MEMKIELGTSSVRSLYNVCEIRSKQVKPSLLKMHAMEKESEAGRSVKEEERRRKIGLANRGKVPWNKGRKHTEGSRLESFNLFRFLLYENEFRSNS